MTTKTGMEFFMGLDYDIERVTLEDAQKQETQLRSYQRWILAEALRLSIRHGRADLVRWLLPVVSRQQSINELARYVFWQAVSKGYRNVIKVILDYTLPNGNKAFKPDWCDTNVFRMYEMYPSINTFLYVIDTPKRYRMVRETLGFPSEKVHTRLWLFWHMFQGTVLVDPTTPSGPEWKDDPYYDQQLSGLILLYVD